MHCSLPHLCNNPDLTGKLVTDLEGKQITRISTYITWNPKTHIVVYLIQWFLLEMCFYKFYPMTCVILHWLHYSHYYFYICSLLKLIFTADLEFTRFFPKKCDLLSLSPRVASVRQVRITDVRGRAALRPRAWDLEPGSTVHQLCALGQGLQISVPQFLHR